MRAYGVVIWNNVFVRDYLYGLILLYGGDVLKSQHIIEVSLERPPTQMTH